MRVVEPRYNRWMNFEQLQAMAQASVAIAQDCDCRAYPVDGWISYPPTLEVDQFVQTGTLVEDPFAEATFAEYHPAGTRYEDAAAPVAPRWYPYNRCDVSRCGKCGRAYLQYNETGGYFTDRRIRALHADRLVDAPL